MILNDIITLYRSRVQNHGTDAESVMSDLRYINHAYSQIITLIYESLLVFESEENAISLARGLNVESQVLENVSAIIKEDVEDRKTAVFSEARGRKMESKVYANQVAVVNQFYHGLKIIRIKK